MLTPVSNVTCDIRGDQVPGTFTESLQGDRHSKDKKYVIAAFKDCTGEKVVQIYIRGLVSSVAQSVRVLRGFKKISLRPIETNTDSFTIFSEYLAFNNINMQYSAEPGVFAIMVGNSSRDVNLSTVTLHVMCKDNII